jgi:hypothetical protein
MHSKLASDWELFVTLRKQKNKEMKRPSGLCSHGMPTRLPHCGGRSMDPSSLAGSKAAARHAIRIHAANSAPVCESIRAADGTEVTESAGIGVP